MSLRLGIIGISPGNGHPFSWAAICNGYDKAAMALCPFPAIPEYLGRQEFPRDRLELAKVTHVWSQDRSVSTQIAKASLIATIVDRPEDMIGAVDGILLARDDAEHHRQFALPFLAAGLPIYIDKPFALSSAAARDLLAEERYPGQIFTGTALAHAAEFRPDAAALAALGDIRRVLAVTPKAWNTYAVHVIEPTLTMLDRYMPSSLARLPLADYPASGALAAWPDGLTAAFMALGSVSAPIRIELFGTAGTLALTFRDSFSAFKEALRRFCIGIATRRPQIDIDRLLAVTAIIETGRTATPP